MSPEERDAAVQILANASTPLEERGNVLVELAALPEEEQADFPDAVRLGIGLIQRRGLSATAPPPHFSAVCTMTAPDGTLIEG